MPITGRDRAYERFLDERKPGFAGLIYARIFAVGSTAARERENVDAGRSRPAPGPRASLDRRLVVTTSSKTFLPLTARALSTLNAPATLRRRWSGESPT